MRKRKLFWVSAVALGAAGGCGGGGGGGKKTQPPPDPVSTVDIRADVNRNGMVDLADPTEDQGEDGWDATHGAIFLANIDDDALICPKGTDAQVLTDMELAKCFDAADDIVNGPDDLNDMARIRTVPWPDAPDNAIGNITFWVPKIADTDQVHAGLDHVRVFKNNGGNFQPLSPDGVITPQELRAGVELAIEAKDIVRDRTKWNGYVDVQFQVKGGTVPPGKPNEGKAYPDGQDIVRLRVAPLLLSHHLQAAQQVYATDVPSSGGSIAFRADLGDAIAASGVPEPFIEAKPLVTDQWIQDWFEIGWMTMPGPNGAQQRIVVNIRSANVYESGSPESPLRPAGRYVYESEILHGKDAAGFTPDFDIKHSGSMDSLNSFGNTETIPPYELNGQKYPMGRLYRGSVPDFYPDPEFQRLLEAQQVQPMVLVDTSWLLVGHVDETITFLKMANARGWGLGVNDPAMAKKMLEDLVAKGQGDILFFVGKKFLNDSNQLVPAEASATQILANTEVMGESANSAVEVDAQLDILKKEVGIADGPVDNNPDMIPMPYLHEKVFGYSLAYQPGTTNGIVLSDKDFGTPIPHGPDVNGQDPFRVQLTAAFSKHAINLHWIEDWDLYHRLSGEVHCGRNTKRALPTNAKWWESGR